ncbi:MAG: pyruvate kinase [Planctomycetota bacterium]|nr:pyruvate kinase [Planctomycetota bacterium]
MTTAATPMREQPPEHTLSKIVATIGPASDSPEMVRRLIEAGVGVFRFNFSHGDFAGHEKRLDVVRQVSAEMNRPVACLGDLQGPKIRVGKVAPVGESKGVVLEPGDTVIIQRDLALSVVEPGEGGTKTVRFPTTYPQMIGEVQPGQRVLINDGAIRMLATEADVKRGELRCVVKVGGLVTSSKGINLPESELSAPAITDRDWECVAWAVENAMDFLALSFVREASEVMQLKERLAGMCPADRASDLRHETATLPVIAKIETPKAVKNIQSIVEASDGIMVARGDLGVEMDIARVPVEQKRIIAACHEWGKPCIVATQMLESMIESPIPTRAEASDVANAIFDGADAVMLSAETATGKFPLVVVDTMRRIIAAAEARNAELPAMESAPNKLIETRYGTAALAHGAWHIARDTGARLIACWSEQGGTARYLSQNNFRVPILAYSSSLRACRRMNLLAGVFPIHMPAPDSETPLADWNKAVDDFVLHRGLCKPGDVIVLLAGRPLGQAKSTNTIALHRVGEPTAGFRGHGA